MIGAIQIVNVAGTKDNRYLELDEIALAEILLKENVRDKPVAVISISGRFREGKSFLLNFLLHHLERKAISASFYNKLLKVSRIIFILF